MDVAIARHDQIGRIGPGLFAPHRWSRASRFASPDRKALSGPCDYIRNQIPRDDTIPDAQRPPISVTIGLTT
jgi:hypothetical protein